jgi:hypothetical protein
MVSFRLRSRHHCRGQVILRVFISLLLLAALSTLSACVGYESKLPTVNGPERADLNLTSSGCVVMERPMGGIVATRLRDLKEIVVRQPERSREIITDVAGPDTDGWIIFIEDHVDNHTFSIRAIEIDGSGERLRYTGAGDSLWDNPISRPSLASKGGSIAFLTQPVKQFARPVVSGPIEIVDFQTRRLRNTGVLALNKGLSWFPDGKRIAYVQPGSLERIFILNIETGENTLFHMGSHPLVSYAAQRC